MRLTDLQLNNVRNFQDFQLENIAPMTAIVGANGLGKTNILEAISLLTPGRGLRNATILMPMRV